MVRRQMKQVVGDLVTVLGELRTVVGDIRTLVSQIDVVTHKIDQSVSSDQSDRSARSTSAKTGTRSTSSSCHEPSHVTSRQRAAQRTETGAEVTHVGSKMVANVCDLSSCFGNHQPQEEKDENPVPVASFVGSSHLNGRQGERLSNHDRVYVAYRPRFARHSIDKRPFSSTAKRTANVAAPPLTTADSSALAADREYRRENVSKPKPLQAKSSAYITHIYENIKAFRMKTSPDSAHKRVAPSGGTQNQTASIPTRRSRCFHSASVASPKLSRHQTGKETSNLLKQHLHKLPCVLHKAKTKAQQEYSGLYEREMEEKLELEFDDSLDLLDTLADIQTVDNDFEQAYDDFDDVVATPVRDPYPIDLIRKHADVVAWAQSAWPEARCTGNSLDCSDDPATEEETDSEWYEQPVVIPKSVNAHFVNFNWRPVIEP